MLIVNWLLALASYFANTLDAASVPPAVADAVNEANVAGVPFGLGLYYLLAYLYFFLFLVSTVGLFAFRNFARTLYVAYMVVGFVIGLVPPLWVMARPYRFVGGLSSLSAMLILTLIFFSPVRSFFGATRAEELH
jgi:hypothetical protein